MNTWQETYLIDLPGELAGSREAIAAVLAWLELQGHAPATTKRWRLPITEAVTNAIVHGCRGHAAAGITIAVRVGSEHTEVRITDPGCYHPAPDAADLGDDPLAEHGRGGFLIAQGSDRFEHLNDERGHTLALHWDQPPRLRTSLVASAGTERALDDLAGQLGEAYEAVTAYAEFAALLATTSDFSEVLSQVQRKLAQAVEHETFLLRFFRDEALVLTEPAPGFPTSIPSSSAACEVRVGTARTCAAFATAAEIPAGDPLGAAAGPVVIVAVGCPKKCRGTLALVRKAGAAAFSAGQIAFAQSAAAFLGTAQSLAESRREREEQVRLEQELQLAARIQHQLFPQSAPAIAGWTVTGACQTSLAMGGDYFDWIVRDDGTCLVLVADVMGKGMPAAMVATMLRSTWRTLAERSRCPGALLTELNHQLARDLATLEVFITAVLVQLSPGSGRARYANAGHCALLQSHASDAECIPHDHGGPPLGIDPRARFDAAEISLTRGQTLFAFTDGCYETDHRVGASLGLEQLERDFREVGQSAAADAVPAVLRRLQERTTGDLPDDCTLVAMRFLS